MAGPTMFPMPTKSAERALLLRIVAAYDALIDAELEHKHKVYEAARDALADCIDEAREELGKRAKR